MKKMSKLLSVIMALAMVMSLTVGVNAAGTPATTYKIEINNSTPGYVYTAYQVFSGDLSTNTNGDKVLSNIKWGSGVNDTALLSAVNTKYSTTLTTAAQVAQELADGNIDAKDFSDLVGANLKGSGTDSVSVQLVNTNGVGAHSSYEITGLMTGYYFVKNTTVPAGGTHTDFILDVVGNATVTHKGVVPTVIKKVKDINDSVDSSASPWQDSADHDIGDTVEYKLEGTLPSNYADYKDYTYIFHDKLSAGLTYNSNAKVYVVNGSNSTEITDDATISYDSTKYELTITFDDLKTITTATIDKDSKILVEYTCTLNSNAVIGSAGNPNEVYLEFSNNPNQAGGGTTVTPKDKVTVFTFSLQADKVDENNAPLTGAGFTLFKAYKLDSNGLLPAGKTEATHADLPTAPTGTKWVAVGAELTGTTTFTWTGIDDGHYALLETTTPAGYNTMDPVEFDVTTTHDTDSADPQLTALASTLANFTASLSTGLIDGDIVNTTGTVLPSTGGIGTTIFTVSGIVLMLGAVILLVSKKRSTIA